MARIVLNKNGELTKQDDDGLDLNTCELQLLWQGEESWKYIALVNLSYIKRQSYDYLETSNLVDDLIHTDLETLLNMCLFECNSMH